MPDSTRPSISPPPSLASHQKAHIALRYWLQGAGYHQAVVALEFAADVHTGLRKDGRTPEVAHPIAVTNLLRTLQASLLRPEPTLVVALLHDTVEDYDVTLDDIGERFGDEVRAAVALLTKVYGTEKRPARDYFEAMVHDPIASVVKGADRIHNVGSMVGVFTPEKMRAYVAEADEWILPMLKEARRRIPAQEPVYENLKATLTTQLALVRGLLAA